MICVSIADCTAQECIKLLKNEEFAEIRLDRIKGIDEAGVKKIFSLRKKLIATCRPGAMDEQKRKKFLLAAIEAGASYVDIEVDASDSYKQEIASAAKNKGCQVIISFHDFKRTPPQAELEKIVEWCFESGAEIVKIACKANSKQDCARLLGLLDTKRKLVVIGMSEKGKMTRIAALLLGSPFTFASISKGKETAEGQIEKKKLKRVIEGIKNAIH